MGKNAAVREGEKMGKNNDGKMMGRRIPVKGREGKGREVVGRERSFV